MPAPELAAVLVVAAEVHHRLDGREDGGEDGRWEVAVR